MLRADWVVAANADNGIATALIPVPHGGQTNFLSHVSVSYDTPGTSGFLSIFLDTGTLVLDVHDSIVIDFTLPLVSTGSNAVTLSASGTGGVVGHVNIAGYTG